MIMTKIPLSLWQTGDSLDSLTGADGISQMTIVLVSIAVLLLGGIAFLVYAWYQNKNNFVRQPKKLSKKKIMKQKQKESRFSSGE